MKSIFATSSVVTLALLLVGGCNNNNGGKGPDMAGVSASGFTYTLTGLGASTATSTPQMVHLAVTKKGAPATGYTGSVGFTSTDTVAYLPAQYTFTAADAGGHDFLATLNTTGAQSVTATDAADSTLHATDMTNVAGAAYYYVPPTGGKIALLPNVAASSPSVAVLDLVALVDLTGYFVGFDLAVDATKLNPPADLITVGNALDPGTNMPALKAAIPTTGPLANALVTGVSQKAAGSGAKPNDAAITAGQIFYTVKLPLTAAATAGTIFDGTVAKNKIRAGLRNKAGTEVVGAADFMIGKLIYMP
jgi:uncharacterized lipoprotein NlpE involved in copper resistance